ncbi:hypothetical protein HPB50_020525 [Hyalomma asiaticum]|uniref:Uncharacterized protein n=1 Tax=Hyalomma asiaticum TaxID=266040 RepID=A0ACB7T747_HYAAI|nr:hypothetical protein HPB50_020525 [Hyalomma asiaticum]
MSPFEKQERSCDKRHVLTETSWSWQNASRVNATDLSHEGTCSGIIRCLYPKRLQRYDRAFYPKIYFRNASPTAYVTLVITDTRDKAVAEVDAFEGRPNEKALVNGFNRRPVYNIYHMANAIWQVDEGMELGANAIESDVFFDKQGSAAWFYHGAPCDCFRRCQRYEEVPTLLRYLRRTSAGGVYRHRLALLFLDLKTYTLYPDKKYDAGADVARKLMNHLWHGVPVHKALNVLLSIPSVDDKEVFLGATETIRREMPEMIAKIGFDVSNNGALDTIENLYRELHVQGHRWQGDGMTNCLSIFRSSWRINSIVENRDAGEPSNFIEKAFQWTIDMPTQLRQSLRRNVDGIITNRPDRLVTILKESEFRSTMRLANATDNPWIRFGCRYNCDRGPFVSRHQQLDDEGIAWGGLPVNEGMPTE